jgi:hypothetical protein
MSEKPTTIDIMNHNAVIQANKDLEDENATLRADLDRVTRERDALKEAAEEAIKWMNNHRERPHTPCGCTYCRIKAAIAAVKPETKPLEEKEEYYKESGTPKYVFTKDGRKLDIPDGYEVASLDFVPVGIVCVNKKSGWYGWMMTPHPSANCWVSHKKLSAEEMKSFEQKEV